jgi:hypothetical protein
MAANSLLDRGWGKAAQLVDIAGEVKQLIEVKLNVVQAQPVGRPTIDATCEAIDTLPQALPQPDITSESDHKSGS